MVYTAVEIVFYLIVAAFLGLVLGWLLRAKSIRERLESQWRRLVDDERDNLRQANEQLKRVRAENDDLAGKAKGLQAKLEKLEPLPGENRKLQKQLEDTQDRLEKLEVVLEEHAELGVQCQALQARIEELKPLEAQNTGLKAKVQALEDQVAELEPLRDQSATLAARVEEQRGRLEELTTLEEEGRGLRSRLEAAQAELSELPSLREENEQLRATVESLRESLAQAEKREADKGSLDTGGMVAEPAPSQESAETSQREPDTEEAEEALRSMAREVAERTRGVHPPADDDLKQIRGVGPVIEKMLKALGITSYGQIARFSDEDLDQVTSAMGPLRGRIQRDSWIEDAREEHRKKYGSEA
jgi:predicted flap endonuclease-1-like 5' DNA nuclease